MMNDRPDTQLKSNAVVNDAALRPPTTMAPPVPSKKKVSIPSVFLVDDKQQQQQQANGNGPAGGYARTTDRPPPRPLRPPPSVAVTGSSNAGGAGGFPGQLKCNTVNMLGSRSSSSSPASSSLSQPQPQPQPPLAGGHSVLGSSQSPLLMLSQLSQSTSHHYASPGDAHQPQSLSHPQPHPPPRRRDQVQSPPSGLAVNVGGGSSPGMGTPLQSKCLSVKVIVYEYAC